MRRRWRTLGCWVWWTGASRPQQQLSMSRKLLAPLFNLRRCPLRHACFVHHRMWHFWYSMLVCGTALQYCAENTLRTSCLLPHCPQGRLAVLSCNALNLIYMWQCTGLQIYIQPPPVAAQSSARQLGLPTSRNREFCCMTLAVLTSRLLLGCTLLLPPGCLQSSGPIQSQSVSVQYQPLRLM